MIVWLASYPRSGNTLLRMVLKHCFNLESYSLYSDQEFHLPKIHRLVGEQSVGPDPHAFLRRMQQEGRKAIIKTHELPGPDSHRAIYVVRNGPSALVSHCHYFRNVLGLHVTLEDVIAGTVFPSWSDHVGAWMLSGRPDVLSVRYETLVRGDHTLMNDMARFLGVPCARQFGVSFSELHAQMPHFFRSGSDSRNVAEMTAQQLKMFERLHGSVSQTIGYGPASM